MANGVQMSDSVQWDALATLQKQLHFITPLCLTPGADENTADMIKVMQNLRVMAEYTGACVTVIHHQRKANSISARAGETLRGHSSIEAAIDLALLVERDPNSATIAVKATKARGYDVLPFLAMFDFRNMQGSTELETAQFYGTYVEDRISDAAIETAILDNLAISANGMSQKDLLAAIKPQLDVGINRIRGLLDKMVKNGKVICSQAQSGRSRSNIYALP